ncbi:alpha/beta hydrolase [Gordonia sp. C13]|uniref:alpha/beta hydrolase n=1 Tax=Gordonia sp. C13 TaxID=2935078 RepID=UPI00200AA89B|nr:alpha/beta hydrolase [Gordonia sp. C13]MCK8616299.1 alpha/beta hydrolase [Gordonia sp. C13]
MTLSVLVVAASLIFNPASASAQGPLLPPAQPSSGLGAQGPCGSTVAVHANPVDATQKIAIHSPTGTAATPLLGGRCNDPKRPVVVIVHGLLAGIDAQLLGSSVLYRDIINHFVAAGNVVVFATWPTNPYNFSEAVAQQDRALGYAQRFTPRADFSKLGFIGHSMGGGALPFLAQQAVHRGWGSSSLWLFQIAPAFASDVGTGSISVPQYTRVVVENFDHDNVLDARIGIEQFNAYDLPVEQKRHITVRSDFRGPLTRLDATHLSANSVLAPNDAIRFYGIYRVGDALQSCALTGSHCTSDLSYMGEWSDGRAVRKSISTTTPVDSGPPANAFDIVGLNGECESPHNVRAGRCPESHVSQN